MNHDLSVLEVLQNGEIRCQCTCGAISDQEDKAFRWTITPNGDGTAAVSPSIDWSSAGHFHTTFARAPLGECDFEKYMDSPAWEIEHPGRVG